MDGTTKPAELNGGLKPGSAFGSPGGALDASLGQPSVIMVDD